MNLGNAAVAPLLGRVLDRFPVRRVFLTCTILLGLSLVTLAFSRSTMLSGVVLAVLLPLGDLGAGSLTMSALIARWFTVQRGRAMAIASIGMALGNVTITPVVGLLIQGEGWRPRLVSGSASASSSSCWPPCCANVPAQATWRPAARRRPWRAGTLVAQAPAAVGAILRSQQFWSIGLSIAAALAVIQTIAITIVPLGQESGLTRSRPPA